MHLVAVTIEITDASVAIDGKINKANYLYIKNTWFNASKMLCVSFCY